ncbi:taste receptor type 2 member 110-like [Psammomys obesus]|uniref:taste receptor type 2 member 110-like n=1 Tax=Psammomys obesus TaxID=48139 RepID=UPI002452F548|nr:taste receptor type 2 member 110-like [Psammomys obesus]
MFSEITDNKFLLAFTIIGFVEIIMGTLGNGFIALVNIMDWIKRRKLSSADQILTALALSRLSFMWYMLVFMLLFMLCPHLFMSSRMLTVSEILWTVNNHFSIWLSTCLSVFYFLKIANFSNSFFLYLKWRVKEVVLLILLVSLIFLILNTVFIEMCHHFLFDVYKENISYSLSDSADFPRVLLLINSSTTYLLIKLSNNFLPINSVFTFIPFTVSLIAFLMLIFSLWKHHRKMKLKTKGHRDVSTMAHMKALQIGFAFLLLYGIYLLYIAIGIFSFDFMEELIFLFDYFSGVAFPISHTFVLILGNSKLRKAALVALRFLWCCSKDVDTVDP